MNKQARNNRKQPGEAEPFAASFEIAKAGFTVKIGIECRLSREIVAFVTGLD